jgi:AhpD family alkylhydroperoxidase
MMDTQRIPSIELSAADERTKRNFEKLTARIGRVPNMPRAMAQSPAALEGWMSLLEALAKGLLSKKLAAELALALAGINHCQYCASSHTVLSKFAGLNDAQIVNALEGKVDDTKDAAAINFAKAVVEKRGRIDDNDFKLVSDAGFTPGEISEIVAHVVLNIFTNYFNLVARTDIDWPQISVTV